MPAGPAAEGGLFGRPENGGKQDVGRRGGEGCGLPGSRDAGGYPRLPLFPGRPAPAAAGQEPGGGPGGAGGGRRAEEEAAERGGPFPAPPPRGGPPPPPPPSPAAPRAPIVSALLLLLPPGAAAPPAASPRDRERLAAALTVESRGSAGCGRGKRLRSGFARPARRVRPPRRQPRSRSRRPAARPIREHAREGSSAAAQPRRRRRQPCGERWDGGSGSPGSRQPRLRGGLRRLVAPSPPVGGFLLLLLREAWFLLGM